MFKMGQSLRFSIDAMRVECGKYNIRKCDDGHLCRETLCPYRVVSKLAHDYIDIIKEIEKRAKELYNITCEQLQLICDAINDDRGLAYNYKFVLYIVYYLVVEYFNFNVKGESPEFVYRIEYESQDDIYTTTHLSYGGHSQYPVFFDPGDFKHIVYIMSNIYNVNILKLIHQL